MMLHKRDVDTDVPAILSLSLPCLDNEHYLFFAFWHCHTYTLDHSDICTCSIGDICICGMIKHDVLPCFIVVSVQPSVLNMHILSFCTLSNALPTFYLLKMDMQ